MFFTLQTCMAESIGLGNIFIIVELALLLFILANLVDKFDKFFKKFGEGKTPEATKEPVLPPTPPALNQNLELIGLDEPTAAVIMAVVSHQSKIPLSNLDFKKIELTEEQTGV